MIEYFTDNRTPAQVEASARDWAAEVRGLSKWRRSKAVHKIAEREGRPALRVFFWIRWAERERK